MVAEMKWLTAADIIEANITRYSHGFYNTDWIQFWINARWKIFEFIIVFKYSHEHNAYAEASWSWHYSSYTSRMNHVNYVKIQ